MKKHLVLFLLLVTTFCSATAGSIGENFNKLINSNGVSYASLPQEQLDELGASEGHMTFPAPNEYQIFYNKRVAEFIETLPEKCRINTVTDGSEPIFYYYRPDKKSPAEVVMLIHSDSGTAVCYILVKPSMAEKCRTDLINQFGGRK